MSYTQRMFCAIKRDGSIIVSENGRAHIYVATEDTGSSVRAERIAKKLRLQNNISYDVVQVCGGDGTTFISEIPTKAERIAERKKKRDRLQYMAARADDSKTTSIPIDVAASEKKMLRKIEKTAKRAKLLAALKRI